MFAGILFVQLSFAEGPVKNSDFSRSQVIEGTVIDERTGETLTGAEIRILGSDEVVYSDLDGKFIIKNSLPGKYTLSVSYISYNKKIITGNHSDNQVIKHTVRLNGEQRQVTSSRIPSLPRA